MDSTNDGIYINSLINYIDDSRIMIGGGEGINDNWYELRFSKVGPDRRGYHSSFVHNKK